MLEERVSDCETMKRENRRVAAMSWGAGDDIIGTPKATRAPHAGKIEIHLTFLRYLVFVCL